MPPTPRFIVRRVSVEEIIDLRHRVLRQGLPRQTAIFPGDEAPDSIHFAAFHETQTIGCATLHADTHDNHPAYKLRGMAVDPGHQRHGIGRLLLAECERAATHAGIRTLWANCRTPAVPFYQKLGWKIVSEEFLVETAGPHFKMVRLMCD